MIETFTITGDSPAATGSAVIGVEVGGLERFDTFIVDATVQGATDDTLDLVLQRKVGDADVWAEWIRFAQLASGAAAVSYTVSPTPSNTIVAVDTDTTASPSGPVMSAGCVGGHPGSRVRLVATAGASTSAGAEQTVRITGIRSRG